MTPEEILILAFVFLFGVALGLLFHWLRTREMRRAFAAACGRIEALEGRASSHRGKLVEGLAKVREIANDLSGKVSPPVGVDSSEAKVVRVTTRLTTNPVYSRRSA